MDNVVVVDASIAAKWILTEDHSAEARRQLMRWLTSGVQPIAPSWFACEIANIFFQHVRRGEMPVSIAQQSLETVLTYVSLYETPASDASRALAIAAMTQQPTPYDAQYLVLAERERCEYWTDDAKFVRAAAPAFPQVKYLRSALPPGP